MQELNHKYASFIKEKPSLDHYSKLYIDIIKNIKNEKLSGENLLRAFLNVVNDKTYGLMSQLKKNFVHLLVMNRFFNDKAKECIMNAKISLKIRRDVLFFLNKDYVNIDKAVLC